MPKQEVAVLRSGRWLPIVGWAVLGVLLAEPIIRGQWAIVLRYSPGVLLAAWLLYLIFWQPRVEVGQDSVTVVNVWSITRVGYALITDISSQGLMTLRYDDGGKSKKVAAWNVVAKLERQPGRRYDPNLAVGVPDLSRQQSPLDHHVPDSDPRRREVGAPAIVRARWMSYVGDAATAKSASSGPNWVAIGGTVLFGGLAIANLLI